MIDITTPTSILDLRVNQSEEECIVTWVQPFKDGS